MMKEGYNDLDPIQKEFVQPLEEDRLRLTEDKLDPKEGGFFRYQTESLVLKKLEEILNEQEESFAQICQQFFNDSEKLSHVFSNPVAEEFRSIVRNFVLGLIKKTALNVGSRDWQPGRRFFRNGNNGFTVEFEHYCPDCNAEDVIQIDMPLPANKRRPIFLMAKVHNHGNCPKCGLEYYRHRFCPAEIQTEKKGHKEIAGYLWGDNPREHSDEARYLVHTTSHSSVEPDGVENEVCTSLIDKKHTTLYRPYGFIISAGTITRRFLRDKGSLIDKKTGRREVVSDVFEYDGVDPDDFLQLAKEKFEDEVWNEVWTKDNLVSGVVIPDRRNIEVTKRMFSHLPILVLDEWKVELPENLPNRDEMLAESYMPVKNSMGKNTRRKYGTEI